MSTSTRSAAVNSPPARSRRLASLVGLAALLAPCWHVQATPRVEPGDVLNQLLSDTPISESRFGVNGTPPGPPGALPRAPNEPGKHWLVVYDSTGNPSDWHRFQVGDGTSVTSTVASRMHIDDLAPVISLRWQDAGPLHAEGQIVGPTARPSLRGEDIAHVDELKLIIAGRELSDPNDWAAGLAEGRHKVEVRSRDRLDNSTIQAQPDLWLDLSAPTLRWERIDPKQGVAEDVFDGSSFKLRLIAEDAVAGVRRVQALDASSEGPQLELDTDQAEVRWLAADRAGNIATGSITLRLDREGPQLRLRRGDEILPRPFELHRSDSVLLEAIDPLAGVAHVCIESSIWRGECRALPITLSGIDPGRYVLRLRGVDRLGNRSNSRHEVEVFP